MRKIDYFLRYLSIFLLFTYFLSLGVVSFVVSFNQESFCYEIIPEGSGLVIGDELYYLNETSCEVVSNEEYHSLKSVFVWPRIFSFIGLLGWFVSSPDFRDRLKEKIKRFKQ